MESLFASLNICFDERNYLIHNLIIIYSNELRSYRNSISEVLLKIFLNSQENNCVEGSVLIKLQVLWAYNFIKQETPTQVFLCEFCEISKNTFFIE